MTPQEVAERCMSSLKHHARNFTDVEELQSARALLDLIVDYVDRLEDADDYKEDEE